MLLSYIDVQDRFSSYSHGIHISRGTKVFFKNYTGKLLIVIAFQNSVRF